MLRMKLIIKFLIHEIMKHWFRVTNVRRMFSERPNMQLIDIFINTLIPSYQTATDGKKRRT